MKAPRRGPRAAVPWLLTLLLAACGTAGVPASSSSEAPASPSTVASQAAAPTATPLPAIPGKIAFSQSHNIWLYVNGQTSQVTTIGAVQNPSWSPDGKQLAFDRTGKNSADLYTMDYPAGTVHQLTNNSSPVVDDNFWEMQPSWSPDGLSLLYASDRGRLRSGTLDLAAWRMTLATRARTQLSSANLYTGGVDYPVWRPGSTQISFTSWTYYPGDVEPYGRLELLDVNSQAEQNLTAVGETAMQASWAPDGRDVALIRRIDGQDQVWTAPVPPPGTDVTLRQVLPSSQAAVAAAAITSSAEPSASAGARPHEPSILDSGTLLVSGTNAHPVWSPAGDAIAYIGLVDGSFDLFVQPLSASLQPAGKPRQLTHGLHIDADSAISWSL